MKNYPLNIFVQIYLAWLIFIFFFTEIISYLHLISRETVIFGNLIFFAGVIIIFKNRFKVTDLSFLKDKIYSLICLILALIFIQGFFSAPNTTDAMTYHITRTMYWIQEKTVSQTFIKSSHDFQPPFGEYILLHLYLFIDDDRLLFLSEWLAFAVIIYLNGLISKRLGVGERGVRLVRIFTATVPIAGMQASSTQVDLVTSALALFGLYFVFNLIQRATYKDSLILGIISGLGMQIKTPFIFYIFIPLVLLVWFKIKKFKNELFVFLIIFLVTLVMQLRYYDQNVNVYGNILGQNLAGEKNTYVNERFDAPALLSNVIRNLFNQVPTPLISSQVEKSLDQMLTFLGSGIKDPKTTYPGHEFHVLSVIYPQEDIVSSPFHLFLVMMALMILLKNRHKIKSFSIIAEILLLWVISFILFAYMLKYEPYHPRLQISYWVFGTVASVIVIISYKWGSKFLSWMLVPTVLLSILVILLNISRPFISYNSFYKKVKMFSPVNSTVPEAFYSKPRQMQYFSSRAYWYGPYNNVTNLIAANPGYKYIVIDLFHDEFEYPFWALLKAKNVDFYIQQNKFVNNPIPQNALILTTSKKPFKMVDYQTECFKTDIEYGYACLSFK